MLATQLAQPLLVGQARFAVLFQHPLVERQARCTAGILEIHFAVMEVRIAGVELPLGSGLYRNPGVAMGMAGKWNEQDFRR